MKQNIKTRKVVIFFLYYLAGTIPSWQIYCISRYSNLIAGCSGIQQGFSCTHSMLK